MQLDNLILLVAGQRTGTNMLRSLLGQHRDIDERPAEVCRVEPAKPWSFPRFFEHLRAQGDIEAAMPWNLETALDGYFRHLLAAAAPRRMIVVDVK